jgi:8-oxo-dGTP pyrophosphatase MutT (NUDIX family)
MSTQHIPVRRIGVRGIIINNGRLFCQQLTANDHGEDSAFWYTPGGGLDENESLLDGLHREMIEETGIAPEIGRLLFVQQFWDGEKEQLEFFFHITNTSDYAHIDLASTSHGTLEIAQCDFIDPKTERVLPAFLQTRDIDEFIASNAPVLMYTELGR